MSQKIVLTCDICGKTVEQRRKTSLVTNDPNGDPAVIGGLKGLAVENNKYKVLDLDFCEERWDKITEFVKTLKG